MKRLLAVLFVFCLFFMGCEKKEEIPTPETEKAPVAEQEIVQPEEQPPVKVAEEKMPQFDIGEGEKTYLKSCSSCHGAGIAGAPKVGDKELWKERIEKGMEVLIENSIKGYRGTSGFMPARGGNASLADEDIANAVAFMVENSK